MGFPVSGVFTVWSRDKVSANGNGQFAGKVSRRQIQQTEAAVNRETEYEESEPGSDYEDYYNLQQFER